MKTFEDSTCDGVLLQLRETRINNEPTDEEEIQEEIQEENVPLEAVDNNEDIRTRSCSSRIIHLWRYLRHDHVQDCFGFFLTKIVLPTLDVATDFSTASNHFSCGNKYWGILTLFPIFLPFMAKILLLLIGPLWIAFKDFVSKCKDRSVLKHKEKVTKTNLFKSILVTLGYLPILQFFRNFRLFIGLSLMDTTLEDNKVLADRLKLKAVDLGVFEAFLESAPQFILQTYIIVETGRISTSQYIGIPISFVSLCYSSMMKFFTQRIDPEMNPGRTLKILIFLLVALQLIGPLFSLVLTSLYLREYLFVAVIITVTLNSLITGIYLRCRYNKIIQENFEGENKCLKKERKMRETIIKLFLKSASTSWISCSSKITTTFFILGTVCNQICHILCIVTIYSLLAEPNRMELSRYPFTHCQPRTLIEPLINMGYCLRNINYLSHRVLVADRCNETLGDNRLIRICGNDEAPTYIFKKHLGPLAFYLLILSCLQYAPLYVFLKFVFDSLEFVTRLFCSCAHNLANVCIGRRDSGTTGNLLKVPKTNIFCDNSVLIVIASLCGFQWFSTDSSGAMPVQKLLRNLYCMKQKQSLTLKLILWLHEQEVEHKIDFMQSSSAQLCSYWIKLVEDNGIDFTENETTVLNLAASTGDSQILQLLIDNGVSLTQRDQSNQSLLHYTSHRGHFDCLSLLLDNILETSSLIDVQNHLGQTAIHVACASNNINCLRLLLDNVTSSSLEKQDSKGQNPLHVATEMENVGCLEQLLNKSTSITLEQLDNSGKTPLQVAVQANSPECIQLLLQKMKASNVRQK